MQKTLAGRVKSLEEKIKSSRDMLYTVFYRDGHKEYKSPGECITLALENWQGIERFQEGENCGNQGCMMGLLNALLDDPDEPKEGADDA